MERIEYIRTADGSNTVFHPGLSEHYHSMHGALQESRHVFLESGLRYFLDQNGLSAVSVLEMGFGTGLNFLLSVQDCLDRQVRLQYTGIEPFPLSPEDIRSSGYEQYVSAETWNLFVQGYLQALQAETCPRPGIRWEIIRQEAIDFETDKRFDLIYFDAFSEKSQPDMWSPAALDHIGQHLKTGGIFVSYAANGRLKRRLRQLGFEPETIPGARGKREMIRATKTGRRNDS